MILTFCFLYSALTDLIHTVLSIFITIIHVFTVLGCSRTAEWRLLPMTRVIESHRRMWLSHQRATASSEMQPRTNWPATLRTPSLTSSGWLDDAGMRRRYKMTSSSSPSRQVYVWCFVYFNIILCIKNGGKSYGDSISILVDLWFAAIYLFPLHHLMILRDAQFLLSICQYNLEGPF